MGIYLSKTGGMVILSYNFLIFEWSWGIVDLLNFQLDKGTHISEKIQTRQTGLKVVSLIKLIIKMSYMPPPTTMVLPSECMCENHC